MNDEGCLNSQIECLSTTTESIISFFFCFFSFLDERILTGIQTMSIYVFLLEEIILIYSNEKKKWKKREEKEHCNKIWMSNIDCWWHWISSFSLLSFFFIQWQWKRCGLMKCNNQLLISCWKWNLFFTYAIFSLCLSSRCRMSSVRFIEELYKKKKRKRIWLERSWEKCRTVLKVSSSQSILTMRLLNTLLIYSSWMKLSIDWFSFQCRSSLEFIGSSQLPSFLLLLFTLINEKRTNRSSIHIISSCSSRKVKIRKWIRVIQFPVTSLWSMYVRNKSNCRSRSKYNDIFLLLKCSNDVPIAMKSTS